MPSLRGRETHQRLEGCLGRKSDSWGSRLFYPRLDLAFPPRDRRKLWARQQRPKDYAPLFRILFRLGGLLFLSLALLFLHLLLFAEIIVILIVGSIKTSHIHSQLGHRISRPRQNSTDRPWKVPGKFSWHTISACLVCLELAEVPAHRTPRLTLCKTQAAAFQGGRIN